MRLFLIIILGLFITLTAPTPTAHALSHVHAVTCSACGGNGVCWVCHGGGKRLDGANCSICGGSGHCSACNGRGDH